MQTRELGMSLVNNPLLDSPYVQAFDDSDELIPPPGSLFIAAESGAILQAENGALFIT